MSAAVGWVLGFGSLVHPDDPLVRRLALDGLAVPGTVAGMRRTWTAGLQNAAPEHDGKHHVDPDGTRPDVVVAALSADEHPGSVLNVLALPVDADGLARTDARERGYDRIEVGGRFAPDPGEPTQAGVGRRSDAGSGPTAGSPGPGPTPGLDGPVWIYTATDRSREHVAVAAREGRAVVSRGYVDRVEEAFRARGPEAWRAYRASTDDPPHPLRDLRLHWAGVRPGE